MNNKLLACLLITGFLVPYFALPQKDVKSLFLSYKSNLGVYESDGYAVRNVELLPDKNQKELIEFTVFAGRRYRLILCSSGLGQSLSIEVFDKPEGSLNRHKVYTNAEEEESEFYIFEPAKIGTFYIECGLPSSGTTNKKSGKIILIVGLKEEPGFY